MNKTVSGLILGVVLSVSSTIVLADYCTSQNFKPTSPSGIACVEGVKWGKALKASGTGLDNNYDSCTKKCSSDPLVAKYTNPQLICLYACVDFLQS